MPTIINERRQEVDQAAESTTIAILLVPVVAAIIFVVLGFTDQAGSWISQAAQAEFIGLDIPVAETATASQPVTPVTREGITLTRADLPGFKP